LKLKEGTINAEATNINVKSNIAVLLAYFFKFNFSFLSYLISSSYSLS
jgi:hypothetical protein